MIVEDGRLKGIVTQGDCAIKVLLPGWNAKQTLLGGIMTKDLAVCIHGNKVNHGEHFVYTEEFLDALDQGLKAKMN